MTNKVVRVSTEVTVWVTVKVGTYLEIVMAGAELCVATVVFGKNVVAGAELGVITVVFGKNVKEEDRLGAGALGKSIEYWDGDSESEKTWVPEDDGKVEDGVES